MKKENWQKIFGVIPDDYSRSLNDTLNSLTEATERRIFRKPMLVLAAALVLLLGIAAAAGNNRMFEIYRKTPIESAEEIVVDISGEPIKVNDDITATVDSVYYDGREIFYEMTLVLTDPESYALVDELGMLRDYIPPTDITHIYLAPRIMDYFEIEDFFDSSMFGVSVSGSIGENALLEDMGNGSYKLYGHAEFGLEDGLTLPEELDLDVSLNLTYSPQVPAVLIDPEDIIDTKIPLHATKTVVTRKYTLTPVTLPEGWTMHSATLEVSAVDSFADFDFSVEREPVEINNVDDMAYYSDRKNFPPYESFDFMLPDPDDTENLIRLTGSCHYHINDGTVRGFKQTVIFNSMDPVPERLTFTLARQEKVEGEWESVPFTTIEFIVTETE